ncbi:hypothetical protein B0H17DRAFT_1190622 [Mycena rosella]|uniref:Uncharacterized protein n=1 Tax=Mycena rosella TaxID=1033263 RepID=A0AAD7MCS7_MYCRO|nr:hypothetical protein B0H17DRAFT_1190622 [Mycena rosella]
MRLDMPPYAARTHLILRAAAERHLIRAAACPRRPHNLPPPRAGPKNPHVPLVGSAQARRMGGLDAEMPRGGARRRGGFMGTDPDRANVRVAQAPAAESMGRGGSPDRPDDIETRGLEAGHTNGESADESITGVETYPVLNQRQEARRLGHFDLHPERRPASVTTNDDAPGTLLSGTTDSEDDHDVTRPRAAQSRHPRAADAHGPRACLPRRHTPSTTRRIGAARSKADSVIVTPAASGHGHGHGHPTISQLDRGRVLRPLHAMYGLPPQRSPSA